MASLLLVACLAWTSTVCSPSTCLQFSSTEHGWQREGLRDGAMDGWMDGWVWVGLVVVVFFGGVGLGVVGWCSSWWRSSTVHLPLLPPPPDDSSCPHSDGTRKKNEWLPLVTLACGPPSLLQRVYQSNTPPHHHRTHHPQSHHHHPSPRPLPLPAPLLFVQPGRITWGRGQDWRPQTTLDQPASTCDSHSSTALWQNGWVGGTAGEKSRHPKTELKLCKTRIQKEDEGPTGDFDGLLGTTPPPSPRTPPPPLSRATPPPPPPLFLPATPELSKTCF